MFLNITMSFSVFSPAATFVLSSLPKIMGSQLAAAYDYFYLKPVAKYSFSPVAQFQLRSREAKQHVRGSAEYCVGGKKTALAINARAVLLISAVRSLYSYSGSSSVLVSPWLTQLKALIVSSCPANFAYILTEKQHLHF